MNDKIVNKFDTILVFNASTPILTRHGLQLVARCWPWVSLTRVDFLHSRELRKCINFEISFYRFLVGGWVIRIDMGASRVI